MAASFAASFAVLTQMTQLAVPPMAVAMRPRPAARESCPAALRCWSAPGGLA
jgi:hypothetical protein